MAVSEVQLRYLAGAEQALKVRDFGEVVSIIYHVISDEDISEGREDLDERWQRIWNKVKYYAPRHIPLPRSMKLTKLLQIFS